MGRVKIIKGKLESYKVTVKVDNRPLFTEVLLADGIRAAYNMAVSKVPLAVSNDRISVDVVFKGLSN